MVSTSDFYVVTIPHKPHIQTISNQLVMLLYNCDIRETDRQTAVQTTIKRAPCDISCTVAEVHHLTYS